MYLLNTDTLSLFTDVFSDVEGLCLSVIHARKLAKMSHRSSAQKRKEERKRMVKQRECVNQYIMCYCCL